MNNQNNSSHQIPSTEGAEQVSLLQADTDSKRLAVAQPPVSPAEVTVRPIAPQAFLRDQDDSELDVRQLFSILVRRWKPMLAMLLSVVTLAAIYSWTSTPIYEAQATIQINTTKGANVTGLDSLGMLEAMTGATESRTQETEAAVMRSAMIQDMALQRLTPKQAEALALYPVTVSPVTKTDLLKIAAQSDDPKLAMARANAIGEAYKERGLSKGRSQVIATASYVKGQMKNIKVSLDQARAALQAYKEKNKTVLLDAESREKIAQLGNVEAALKQAQADYAGSVAQVSSLRAQAAKIPLTSKVPERYVPPAARVAIQAELSKLELEKAAKSSDYQPGSRYMRELQTRIDDLQKSLRGKPETTVESFRNETNPVRLSLDQTIAQTQGNIWSTEAKIKALNSLSQKTRDELARLPMLESQLGQLMGDLETYSSTYKALGDKYQALLISINAVQADAEILDPAKLPKSPIKPRKLLNVVAAFVLGTLLAFLLAAVLERLDDRIHTAEEATNVTGLPVLAHVPLIHDDQSKQILAIKGNENPLLREGFRMLRTNISFLAMDAPIRSIVMTSTQPGEGKSLSSVNLAITAAQSGEKVILVDCDLRRPSVHRLLGLHNKVGFTSVVSGACTLDEALQQTEIPNLRVLACGPVPPDSFALLKSRAGRACFEKIFQSADFVVLDTPPALVMADAQLVASMADAVLLVVSCKEAPRRDIARTRDMLAQTGAGLLGVVFNKASDGVIGYDYYKYRYYSHYFKDGPDADDTDLDSNGAGTKGALEESVK